jgi:ATP phosphoribosyltransferase
MKGLQGEIEVVFQRVRDIPRLLSEKAADLGITGLDVFCEKYSESTKGELFTIFPDEVDPKVKKIDGLPYGQCELVIAVPDHWVDVSSAHDLSEKAREIRDRNPHGMRVATEFRRLTTKFLLEMNVSHFDILEVHGAAESAPRMGAAEIVADLRSSGVTLAENRLKEVADGTIISSSACLIASKSRLSGSDAETVNRRMLAKQFIDRVEGYLKARKFCLVTANIEGDGLEDLRERLCADLDKSDIRLLGREGPTVAPVLHLFEKDTGSEHTYSVSIQIESRNLERVVEILRTKTGRDILVSPITFVYDIEPEAYHLLRNKLGIKDGV